MNERGSSIADGVQDALEEGAVVKVAGDEVRVSRFESRLCVPDSVTAIIVLAVGSITWAGRDSAANHSTGGLIVFVLGWWLAKTWQSADSVLY